MVVDGSTRNFVNTGNSVCGGPPDAPDMIECDRCDGYGIDPESWCNNQEEVCKALWSVEVWRGRKDHGDQLELIGRYCSNHINIPEGWNSVYKYTDEELDNDDMLCEKCHGECVFEEEG